MRPSPVSDFNTLDQREVPNRFQWASEYFNVKNTGFLENVENNFLLH